MNRETAPHIYFIRPVGAEGPIKVGYTTHIPLRLQTIAKWSPIPLEVAATLIIPDAGSNSGICNKFERQFHLRYEAHRSHQEWFAAHPTILADIDNINAGTFNIDCLPAWRKVSNDFMRREYPNGVTGGRPKVAA